MRSKDDEVFISPCLKSPRLSLRWQHWKSNLHRILSDAQENLQQTVNIGFRARVDAYESSLITSIKSLLGIQRHFGWWQQLVRGFGIAAIKECLFHALSHIRKHFGTIGMICWFCALPLAISKLNALFPSTNSFSRSLKCFTFHAVSAFFWRWLLHLPKHWGTSASISGDEV